MKHKKKLLFLIPLAAAGILSYRIIQSRSANGAGAIRVSGNIEITDVDVSFKVPGRVEARPVSEGEIVRAGSLVAKLDSTELMQDVALRKAEVQAAGAALAALQAGSRPEEIAEADAVVRKAQSWVDELANGSRSEDIAAQRARVARAKAEAERLESDYRRQKMLHERDVISAREYETAQTALEVGKERLREDQERLKLLLEGPRKEQIEQARASLHQAQERYALIKKGPRAEDIAQARARLEQARQALAIAGTRLSYATVVAPLAGVVLSENVEPGMYVAPGTPVVTVGDLENVWLRAYINEADLGRVKVGQQVRLTTDTYPGKHYEGRVSFIASQAEFTPKNVQTGKERVKLVYRVKVDIRNPNMELKPGMPADAEIEVAARTDGQVETSDARYQN
ncbi:MAG: efflux RND transporter periplasmic adaptor subunit [Bryobacterales bacterium]|nr:efflux RND transporter periplasmic adaptor subunit [Bryobacterales bacterium]